MEASASKSQPPLMDRFLQLGKAAFDPDLPEETRRQNQSQFKALVDRQVLSYARVRFVADPL
jgi:hypothetical protein